MTNLPSIFLLFIFFTYFPQNRPNSFSKPFITQKAQFLSPLPLPIICVSYK